MLADEAGKKTKDKKKGSLAPSFFHLANPVLCRDLHLRFHLHFHPRFHHLAVATSGSGLAGSEGAAAPSLVAEAAASTLW